MSSDFGQLAVRRHLISGKNADFKKSIDAMQAYRSDQYLWWQVAEYTYDSFMIRSRTRG